MHNFSYWKRNNMKGNQIIDPKMIFLHQTKLKRSSIYILKNIYKESQESYVFVWVKGRLLPICTQYIHLLVYLVNLRKI